MEKILDTENLVWEIRIPIFFISNFEIKSGSVKKYGSCNTCCLLTTVVYLSGGGSINKYWDVELLGSFPFRFIYVRSTGMTLQ